MAALWRSGCRARLGLPSRRAAAGSRAAGGGFRFVAQLSASWSSSPTNAMSRGGTGSAGGRRAKFNPASPCGSRHKRGSPSV